MAAIEAVVAPLRRTRNPTTDKELRKFAAAYRKDFEAPVASTEFAESIGKSESTGWRLLKLTRNAGSWRRTNQESEEGLTMASIDKRPNGKYRARWREVPGGPRKTQLFGLKKDAQNFLDRLRGDMVRGAYVDPALGQRVVPGVCGTVAEGAGASAPNNGDGRAGVPHPRLSDVR